MGLSGREAGALELMDVSKGLGWAGGEVAVLPLLSYNPSSYKSLRADFLVLPTWLFWPTINLYRIKENDSMKTESSSRDVQVLMQKNISCSRRCCNTCVKSFTDQDKPAPPPSCHPPLSLKVQAFLGVSSTLIIVV